MRPEGCTGLRPPNPTSLPTRRRRTPGSTHWPQRLCANAAKRPEGGPSPPCVYVRTIREKNVSTKLPAKRRSPRSARPLRPRIELSDSDFPLVAKSTTHLMVCAIWGFRAFAPPSQSLESWGGGRGGCGRGDRSPGCTASTSLEHIPCFASQS